MRNLNDSQIQSGWNITDQNFDQKEKNHQLDSSNLYQYQRVSREFQDSPHIDKYNFFFRNIKEYSKQMMIQKLLTEGITYDPLLNNQIATISQLKSSLNFEASLLQVRLGPFYIPITILNRSDRSPFHSCETIGRGAAGQVFEATCNNHKFVIKCIKCTDYTSRKNPLLSVIQQYAMFKICSALQVGPKLQQYMGFDIVCYTDCIQFAMQKCVKIQHCGKIEQKQIKQCLKLMHLLQIAHFDIKPANINFSPSFSKPIFIDFGFSRALSAPIGKMKLMVFIGTIGYCSEEMNEAYFSEEYKFIDPYYNDVVGLQRSLVVLKKQKGVLKSQQVHAQSYFNDYSEVSNKNIIDSDNESQKQLLIEKIRSSTQLKKFNSSMFKHVQEELLYYRILSLIFTSKHEYISLSHQQQQILPNYLSKIINFLNSLTSSSQITAFYEKYIKFKSSFDDKINHSFLKLSNFRNTDERNFIGRLSPLLNYEINLIDFKNKRGNNDFNGNKQVLLEGKSQFVSNQDYLLTLLEYIRFNHLNQSADKNSKQQVCRVFLQLKPQEDYSFGQIIGKTFIKLMEYCLESNFNVCTRYLFSHVFEHICVLNILSLNSIQKTIQRVFEASFSAFAKICFFIQIDRCLVWKQRSMLVQRSNRYITTLHTKSLLYNLTFKLILNFQGIEEKDKRKILKYFPNYFYLKQTNFSITPSFSHKYVQIMSRLAGRQLTNAQRNWLNMNILARQCENLIMRDVISTRKHLLQLQIYLSSNNHSYIQSYHIIIADYQYLSYNEVAVAQFSKALEAKLGDYYQIYDFRLKLLNMRAKRSFHDQKYYVQSLISTLKQIQKTNNISQDLYRQSMKCYLALKSTNSQLELIKPLQNAIDCNQTNYLTTFSWILFNKNQLFNNYHEDLLKLYLNYHMIRKNKFKNYSIIKIINKFSASISEQMSLMDSIKLLYSSQNLRKVLLWLLTLIYFQGKDYQMIESLHLKVISLQQNNTEYTRLKKYLMLVFMLQNCKQKRNKYAYQIYCNFNKQMTIAYLFYHSVKIFIYILDYIIDNRSNKEQEVVELFFLLSANLEISYHKNKLNIYKHLIQYFVRTVYLVLSPEMSLNILQLSLNHLQKHPYLSLLVIKQVSLLGIMYKANYPLAVGLSKISNQARQLVYSMYLRNILQNDCPPRKQKINNLRCNKKDAWKKNIKIMRSLYCDKGKITHKQHMRNKLRNYFRNYNNHNVVHFSNENPMSIQDI